jgi:hypothetical protein
MQGGSNPPHSAARHAPTLTGQLPLTPPPQSPLPAAHRLVCSTTALASLATHTSIPLLQ